MNNKVIFKLFLIFKPLQLCLPLSHPLAHNGWRLGVRAGEHKCSDGRQTFKFLQNFLRADTPHDAKPFVGCSVFIFVLQFFLLSFLLVQCLHRQDKKPKENYYLDNL